MTTVSKDYKHGDAAYDEVKTPEKALDIIFRIKQNRKECVILIKGEHVDKSKYIIKLQQNWN